MRFNSIYLYPSLEQFDTDLTSQFRYQTRKMCNFLGRYAAKYKISTESYNRVCFTGVSSDIKAAYANTSNVLDVNFPITIAEYNSRKESELDEYFISLLEIGMEYCPQGFGLPKDIISKGIEEFRIGSYKNEWILKSKKLKNRNFTCTLSCSLTFYEFALMAKISDKNGKLIESVTVLRTEPDEIFFNRYLHKNFYQNGDTILFKKKDGRPFFEFTLPETVL